MPLQPMQRLFYPEEKEPASAKIWQAAGNSLSELAHEFARERLEGRERSKYEKALQGLNLPKELAILTPGERKSYIDAGLKSQAEERELSNLDAWYKRTYGANTQPNAQQSTAQTGTQTGISGEQNPPLTTKVKPPERKNRPPIDYVGLNMASPKYGPKIGAALKSQQDAERAEETLDETAAHHRIIEDQGQQRIDNQRNQFIAKAEATNNLKKIEDYNKDLDSTKKYREEVSNKAQAARKNNTRLDRYKGLEDKNNFSNPLLAWGVDLFGLPTGFTTAETQELATLQAFDLETIKDYFKGSSSNEEMYAFLAKLPKNTQSSDGRRAAIRAGRFSNWLSTMEDDFVNAYMKKYADEGKAPPRNVRELARQKMSRIMEKGGKIFMNGRLPATALGFGSLGDPQEYEPGAELTDTDTGEQFVVSQDGTSWLRKV